MATHNKIEEIASNVVKITTGGIEKEYNKTDLKCSSTDISVFVYYYTDSTNKIIASWNEYQAEQYGYTLSSLKAYIDTLLNSNSPKFSGLNLSSISQYNDQSDAISNGLKNGDVYCLPKTNNKVLLAIVRALIQSYSSGKSTIGFTSDGNDGWDISIVANPTTVQLPNSETITGVAVEVLFWNGGNSSSLYSNTYTTDQVLNTGANGAGMYEVLLTYNVSDGSQFQIFALIVVDATNTILAYYKMLGVAVSNVNGLNIDVDADISQSGTLSIDWIASDGITPTMVGSGDTDTLTLLPTTVGVGQMVTLDSNFSDYPNAEYFSGFTVTIN